MSRLPTTYLEGVLRLHADEFPTSTPELAAHIAAIEAETAEARRIASERATKLGRVTDALRELVEAVIPEVNEKGAGGYLLARLSDAKDVLTEPPK